MSTVETAHRVCHKIQTTALRFLLKEAMKILGTGCNRAGSVLREHPNYLAAVDDIRRDSCDDDFCAHSLSKNAQDARPVLHSQPREGRWPPHIKAI